MKQLGKYRVRTAAAVWAWVISALSLGQGGPAAAATLKAGDLMVFGKNAHTDTYHLVALADMPANTQLRLTDHGWSSANAFTAENWNDGTVYWNLVQPVAKGSVLELMLGGGSRVSRIVNLTTVEVLTSEVTESGYGASDPINNSNYGDGLLIYQDDATNPFFISGFNSDPAPGTDNGWAAPGRSRVAALLAAAGRDRQPECAGQRPKRGGHDRRQGIPQRAVRRAHQPRQRGRLANVGNWTGDDTWLGGTRSTIDVNFGKRIEILDSTTPALTLDAGTLTYAENGPTLPVSPGAIVTGAEDEWFGGSQEVRIAANAEAADRLRIGAGTGLSVSGVDLYDGAVAFGTLNVAGGTVSGGARLAVTFNPQATTARVQKLIRAIAYLSTSEVPAAAARVVDFGLRDGAERAMSAARSVAVQAVDDWPRITAPASIAVTGDVPIVLSGIAVSDLDAGNVSRGLSLNVVKGSFSAVAGSGVTVIESGGGALVLAGTVADLNAFLGGGKVRYTPAPNSNGRVDLKVIFTDGNVVAEETVALNIAPVEDGPQLNRPASISVAEDQPMALTGISLYDPDVGDAEVGISFGVGSGRLSAASGSGVRRRGDGERFRQRHAHAVRPLYRGQRRRGGGGRRGHAAPGANRQHRRPQYLHCRRPGRLSGRCRIPRQPAARCRHQRQRPLRYRQSPGGGRDGDAERGAGQ